MAQSPSPNAQLNLTTLADAVMRMEGAMDPNSINMFLVRNYGLWNVGHLIWAGQTGASKVWAKDRYWAGWPTQADAYAGLQRDLLAKARAGYTIRQAFEVYAPPKENNTEVYISQMAMAMGAPDSTPLSSLIGGSVAPPFGQSPGLVDLGPDQSNPDQSTNPDQLGSDEPTTDASLFMYAGLGLAVFFVAQFVFGPKD